MYILTNLEQYLCFVYLGTFHLNVSLCMSRQISTQDHVLCIMTYFSIRLCLYIWHIQFKYFCFIYFWHILEQDCVLCVVAAFIERFCFISVEPFCWRMFYISWHISRGRFCHIFWNIQCDIFFVCIMIRCGRILCFAYIGTFHFNLRFFFFLDYDTLNGTVCLSKSKKL